MKGKKKGEYAIDIIRLTLRRNYVMKERGQRYDSCGKKRIRVVRQNKKYS